MYHYCRAVFGYDGKTYDLKVVETGGTVIFYYIFAFIMLYIVPGGIMN